MGLTGLTSWSQMLLLRLDYDYLPTTSSPTMRYLCLLFHSSCKAVTQLVKGARHWCGGRCTAQELPVSAALQCSLCWAARALCRPGSAALLCTSPAPVRTAALTPAAPPPCTPNRLLYEAASALQNLMLTIRFGMC